MCLNRCRDVRARGMALTERRAGRVVVTMRGEHDVSTGGPLWATMAAAIALDVTDVVVDMSMVAFMDASTIRVLERLRNGLQDRSRSLTVRDPSAYARRLLDLCGLAELIELEPTDLAFTRAIGRDPWALSHPASGIDAMTERPALTLCPDPSP